ncbi:MAG: restriction endonuclease subunit S [Chthoniobacterales bacterium]|nr:restriction endonuclease subunit S [Chthoniobacterales bacterium]
MAEVRKGYTPFRDGDVIFAKVTPCMENGKAAVMKGLTNGVGFGSTEFFALRPSARIDANYLLHFLLQRSFRQQAARNMTGAVGLRRVPKSYLEQQQIPLPPIDQQQRIVAAIEKQFTRLEAGVAALRRVQANLKRYRAAVLKAACEGRLVPTEADLCKTRNQKGEFETGEALLACILTERRANWKGKGRGQYQEPATPVTTQLGRLPEGWTWATVEQLSTRVQYGSSEKTNGDSTGVPVLRMGNIQDGMFDFDSLKYLPNAHDEFPELLLAKGDLLFNRTNSAELVGKTAVFKGAPDPCSFASYLIRVRFGEGCIPDFVSYFINSILGRAWIAGVVSQQVGQANVNGTKLQALAIPLPPFAEQQRIVAEVERRLSVIEEVEAVIAANLQRVDRLRQSILKQAISTTDAKFS